MTKDDLEKIKKSMPSKGFSNTPHNILDDCDRPACDDTMSALTAALNHAQQNKTISQQQQQCPPSKSQLGRSSWDLLHSMAAWYPDHPTPTDRTSITEFFDGFARFYPCTWCAEDFQHNLKQKPVESASRKDLCIWLCQQHNIVNEKLGKPLFPCDLKTLDERWRKSSNPDCQP